MMPDPHPSKPPSQREDALAIVRQLREAGQVAYFAGGCVRDALLGLHPSDFDVATDAPPQTVRRLFPQTQSVGAAFGVILVHLGQSVVEVATFRSEGGYEDGRRPSRIHFASPREDAQRRDFTINGLFYDPLEERVIDYVGGQADLADRRLRAIGSPADRFREDHLRLLRAVRFAARFDLHIEAATAQAIRHDAPLLRRISPERIADELRRMLTPGSRGRAWRLLWEFTLVDTLFRFLPDPQTGGLDAAHCPFLALEGPAISFPLALAAGGLSYRLRGSSLSLLLEKEQAGILLRATRQALRLSNEELAAMSEILASCQSVLSEGASARVATLKRFLARPTAPQARALLSALAHTGRQTALIDSLQSRLTELSAGEVAPPPLLTGDDLVAAGLSPGPHFKRILSDVYDAQLEQRILTREAALEMALAHLPDAPRR